MTRPAKYGQARPRTTTRPTADATLPPAGRNTPAARAYSNANRSGRTAARHHHRHGFLDAVLSGLLGSRRRRARA